MWAHCMKANDYQDLIDRGNYINYCESHPLKKELKHFLKQVGGDLDNIVISQITNVHVVPAIQ